MHSKNPFLKYLAIDFCHKFYLIVKYLIRNRVKKRQYLVENNALCFSFCPLCNNKADIFVEKNIQYFSSDIHFFFIL